MWSDVHLRRHVDGGGEISTASVLHQQPDRKWTDRATASVHHVRRNPGTTLNLSPPEETEPCGVKSFVPNRNLNAAGAKWSIETWRTQKTTSKKQKIFCNCMKNTKQNSTFRPIPLAVSASLWQLFNYQTNEETTGKKTVTFANPITSMQHVSLSCQRCCHMFPLWATWSASH